MARTKVAILAILIAAMVLVTLSQFHFHTLHATSDDATTITAQQPQRAPSFPPLLIPPPVANAAPPAVQQNTVETQRTDQSHTDAPAEANDAHADPPSIVDGKEAGQDHRDEAQVEHRLVNVEDHQNVYNADRFYTDDHCHEYTDPKAIVSLPPMDPMPTIADPALWNQHTDIDFYKCSSVYFNLNRIALQEQLARLHNLSRLKNYYIGCYTSPKPDNNNIVLVDMEVGGKSLPFAERAKAILDYSMERVCHPVKPLKGAHTYMPLFEMISLTLFPALKPGAPIDLDAMDWSLTHQVPELVETARAPEYDFVFFGMMNERRINMEKRLRKETSLKFLMKTFSIGFETKEQRDAVSKAKFILCMHYYTPRIASLEVHRINPMLARGMCVLGERGNDPLTNRMYKEQAGLTLVDYDDLPAALVALATNKTRLELCRRTGYQFIVNKRLNYPHFLHAAVNQMPPVT